MQPRTRCHGFGPHTHSLYHSGKPTPERLQPKAPARRRQGALRNPARPPPARARRLRRSRPAAGVRSRRCQAGSPAMPPRQSVSAGPPRSCGYPSTIAGTPAAAPARGTTSSPVHGCAH
ncbi:hypothetical protein G6F32_016716 [Rhizopus arrhizus]|nr:hypothetical protein G6F32_016716 [Rhizopus arrhizus]